MDFWYALLKGALQGLTEFLPVSSSAHLVLFDVFCHLFGWVEHRQSPVVEEFFDILLHLGTLTAVVIYFRTEVMAIFKALPLLFKTPKATDDNAAASLVRGLVLSFFVTAVVSVGGIKGSEILFSAMGWATPLIVTMQDGSTWQAASFVVIYFRSEVMAIFKALPLLFKTPKATDDNAAASLVRGLALSFFVTAVVSVGGIKGSEILFSAMGWATPLMGDISAFYRLHPEWVAVNLLITGLLLWFSEWRSDVAHKKQEEALFEGTQPLLDEDTPMKLSLKQAFTIGFFQACAAMFRGISRSGSTMASSLLVGLTRQQAARYSFLLSVPIFVSAAIYEFLKLAKSGVSFEGLPWLVMLAGVASSAIVGYLCIAWFIKLISKVSLTVFSIYCWIAGTVLLIILPKVAL
jgi:undecaprenyl pyrophosphate phosphatase UppP